MDFIDHNIFDIWGFHLRVPLGLEIEKPAKRVLRRHEERKSLGRWQTSVCNSG